VDGIVLELLNHDRTNDYARYYQWPNAFCFSTWFLNAAQRAVNGRFVVESIEDQGIRMYIYLQMIYTPFDTVLDYPRTLREWGRRLQKNWNEENVAKLLRDRPDLNSPGQLSFFKRNFEYMCAYTEVGYARAYLSLMVFTFARPVSCG
jgi:cyclopropane-fatty-acyl-phospholipid synthase